jgi:glycosyltransferase involved in cell wall biosynthesis
LLHVAQIGFFHDHLRRAPRQLLAAWPSLADIAQSATHAPARVSVIQSAAVADMFELDCVDYHFVAPASRSSTIARTPAFADLIRRLQPDVFHVHGFGFSEQLAELARLAPQTPILVQDHADRPPRLWHRAAWRRGLRTAAGVAFCAVEQAAPFVRARLVARALPVFEVPESTSRFTPGDRDAARLETGLDGDPGVLWVGRLDANKDPLTLLEGVRRALPALPGLKLWCCFGSTDRLAEMTARIESDPVLRARVHLLGKVPHARVETLMRAADLYVSASHREGSGYSLIEALACGLTPVVTDIPSFRALTGRGAIGCLWPVGDAVALSRALVDSAAALGPAARARARAHFEQDLSFAAVGRALGTAYRALLAFRASRDTEPTTR